MQLRWIVLAILAVISLGSLAAVQLVWQSQAHNESSSSGTALIGGPFSLTDQHGQTVTDAQFRGRYMLIYFGYTFCPDFCPLSLTNMSEALQLLTPEEAARVVPVFITIDPARDTVAQMASYAEAFDPRLVALTGDEPAVAAAAKAYRVYYAKAGDGTDYGMDHSTFIYLMAPDGQYRTHFGHDVTPAALADSLRAELAKD